MTLLCDHSESCIENVLLYQTCKKSRSNPLGAPAPELVAMPAAPLHRNKVDGTSQCDMALASDCSKLKNSMVLLAQGRHVDSAASSLMLT
jgi:hypothetical protein